MKKLEFALPKDRLESLCRQYNVQKLSLFGSALTGNLREDSDLDLLVEFEQGKTPGFGYFRLEDDLSKIFGRKVDLNTPGFLSRYFREKVQQEAVPIYERE